MRRLERRTALVGVLCALALLVACDSFGTADDELLPVPPVPEAGAGDAASVDAVVNVDGGPPAPTLLGTSTAPVHWITFDTTRVIWATGFPEGGGNGQLYTCAKSGCSGMPSTLGQPANVSSLATTGATAFVAYAYGGRGIERIDPAGTLTGVSAVSPKNGIFNLSSRDGSLFYMVYGSVPQDGGPTLFTRDVYELPLPAGPPAQIGAYGPDTMNVGSFVIAKDHAFLGAHNTGAIFTCPRTGCVSFAAYGKGDAFYAGSLATDDNRLYWTNTKDLVSCDVASPTCEEPTKEIEPPAAESVLSIEQRDGFLYMLRGNGDVAECRIEGGCRNSIRVLAHENAFFVSNASARNFVVDDSSIYYVARDGSVDAGDLSYRVMRLARPAR